MSFIFWKIDDFQALIPMALLTAHQTWPKMTSVQAVFWGVKMRRFPLFSVQFQLFYVVSLRTARKQVHKNVFDAPNKRAKAA
jgi:hypothetical protein